MRAAIVCGPRDGSGDQLVWRAMSAALATLSIPRWDYLVVGSDRGTDWEAWQWAISMEIPALVCPARWKTGRVKGPREGPIRNLAMYRWVKPVVLFGFPSNGPGTNGMVEIGCSGKTPSFWWSEFDLTWLRDERSL